METWAEILELLNYIGSNEQIEAMDLIEKNKSMYYKYFYKYKYILVKNGLIEIEKIPGTRGRHRTVIRLTEKGKEVMKYVDDLKRIIIPAMQ
jgi:predicted transcriptional regulator